MPFNRDPAKRFVRTVPPARDGMLATLEPGTARGYVPTLW